MFLSRSLLAMTLCILKVLINNFKSSEAFSQNHLISSNQIKLKEQYYYQDDNSVIGFRNAVKLPRLRGKHSVLNMVWFFGGAEEAVEDAESCELVGVKIEKTSANSRRIGGEIVVNTPLDDVWAILTDYDNLSSHIPNLVESRRIGNKGKLYDGEPGDGSYKCQLYQKGAQKIIGFDFRASVTMDMVEKIMVSGNTVNNALDPKTLPVLTPEKCIGFKCVDSLFFSEFDGEWKVKEVLNRETGEPQSTVSYIVDVRPRGPVPVAALEWRIREDVPTNLRALKKSAQEVGLRGVMASRKALSTTNISRIGPKDRVEDFVGRFTKIEKNDAWSEEETMAMYLQDDFM